MNLSAMDLNLLRVLHTLLEERSVRAAATRLRVTPPAVSNALARLRVVLRDPLFVRDGRGIVPTSRAAALAPDLKEAMARLEAVAAGDAAFDPATTQRQFVIACTDADQLVLIPALCERMQQRLPQATLRVMGIDALEAQGGMGRADVDVVLGPAIGEDSALRCRPLYEAVATLVVRQGHPVTRGKLTAARFAALRHVDTWLVLGKPGMGHRHVQAALRRAGVRRDVAVVVPSFMAAAMIVAETDYVAGMPRPLAERLAQLLPLQLLPYAGLSTPMRMQLWWHERTHADPAARCFRELISETAASLGARRRTR